MLCWGKKVSIRASDVVKRVYDKHNIQTLREERIIQLSDDGLDVGDPFPLSLTRRAR